MEIFFLINMQYITLFQINVSESERPNLVSATDVWCGAHRSTQSHCLVLQRKTLHVWRVLRHQKRTLQHAARVSCPTVIRYFIRIRNHLVKSFLFI